MFSTFFEGIESRLRELAALSSTLIESDIEQMSADDHAAVWALVGNIADQSLMLLHGLSERLREIEQEKVEEWPLTAPGSVLGAKG